MEPLAFGANPSEPQPVGVMRNVFSENADGASQELARLSEVPSAHDVGMRMKLPLLAFPSKVSATFVIWIGMLRTTLIDGLRLALRPSPRSGAIRARWFAGPR